LGAALTGQSGLATAGPKLVKGSGPSPGRSQHTALVLDSNVHLLIVSKAGTFV
jgi:hypothetical protein